MNCALGFRFTFAFGATFFLAVALALLATAFLGLAFLTVFLLTAFLAGADFFASFFYSHSKLLCLLEVAINCRVAKKKASLARLPARFDLNLASLFIDESGYKARSEHYDESANQRMSSCCIQ
jgi:hypothetical protein